MRILVFLFTLTISFSFNAQTFIGKTQAEIVDIQTKNGNVVKCSVKNSSQNDMTIVDNKHSISFYFAFNEKDFCIAYSIRTNMARTRDSVQAVIEKLCDKKLIDKTCNQALDGKTYKWLRNDISDHEWEFIATKKE